MALITTSQNLSAVPYARAETLDIRNGATLAITATPPTRMGTIQCVTSGTLLIENSSPTVPLVLTLDDMNHDFRFEAGGIFKIRGAPMSLGVGTGAAQSFDFTTLFGGAVPHMTYCEIEEVAGSGVYMPWLIIDEDPKYSLNVGANTTLGGAGPTAFTAGSTPAGRVLFWHETNRTLRCGDGVNGGVIPAGCAIRIPNIYITNRFPVNSTRIMNIATQGTPTGGTFTLEISSETGTVLGTTAAIPFNATAAQIDTAIEAITGAGTVTSGSGPLPAAVSVTWAGSLVTGFGTFPRVRVASSALTGGGNPTVHCYENNAGNMTLVDLAPLGTLDAEWVSFSHKVRLVVDTFKSIRLVSVGTGCDALQLNNSNGSVELDGVSNTRSPFVSQATSQIASVLGVSTIKRFVTAAKNAASTNITTLPALATVDRLTCMIYGTRNSSNNRGLQMVTLPAGLTMTNLVSIGAGMSFQNLTNTIVSGWGYADESRNVQVTGNATSAAHTANCVGVTFAGYANAGPAAARNYLIATDAASSNLKFISSTTNGVNNSAGFLMACGGMELSNIAYSNLRSAALLDLPSNYLANNLIAKKVFATHGSAPPAAGLDACQGGQYDMVTSTIAGITETFSGVNDFVGGNYTDPSLTPTTGHVTFGPFGAGVGLDLTGAAFTDALGGVLLPENGDTFTATIPFAMHGITAFQSVDPYLYVDAPGIAANLAVFGNLGNPTGGTFTLTIYDAVGALIGTTASIAYNASSTTMGTAISAVVGAGASCSGTWIAGFQITFPAGQVRIVTIDGTALTGGAEPGVAYAVGRARLLTGTERLGSIITAEFGMRVPGAAWPVYQSLTGANLAAALTSLAGYSAGTGVELRIKVTTPAVNPFTRFNQISLPTNVNPALWVLTDSSITLRGPQPTDIVEIRSAADNSLLYTFTGSGTKDIAVGANYATQAYFVRKNASGIELMRTQATPFTFSIGNLGTFNLFAGAEVQLAEAGQVAQLSESMLTLPQIEASVVLAKEATVTALATVNQVEHDATQAALAALPAPLDSTQTQAAAAAALTVYDAVVPADLAGLALESSVNAIPTNPLLTSDTRLNNLDASISTRSTLTAPQVRTELATELGRIDVAVSTRLATSAYTAPTAAPSAADNAAAVRTNLSTELGRIDATVSSRLATVGYTAPPALSAIRADIERTGGMLDAAPTLAEIEASTVLAKQSGFTGLATASNVTAAQTAIVGEVNANEVKLDAVKTDTAAIKGKTDTLVNGPTAAAIRAELENVGSVLHKTFKAATSWWR